MTLEERLVISAYTGVLMCDFDIFHEYAQKVLNRTIFSHEFIFDSLEKELKDAVRDDFIALCGND